MFLRFLHIDSYFLHFRTARRGGSPSVANFDVHMHKTTYRAANAISSAYRGPILKKVFIESERLVVPYKEREGED